MKRLQKSALVPGAHFFVAILVLAGTLAFTVPPLTGPVVDNANMFSPASVVDVNARLTRLWHAGGSQIAVLTVPSLNGEPIEAVSIQVTDVWKLGDKTRDNGVLILIAKEDRTLRIEVGQGLEGDLPDAYARRIIADIMTPAFKNGRFDDGLINGINAVIARTDPTFEPDTGDSRAVTNDRVEPPLSNFAKWVRIFFMLAALWFFLFTSIGRTLLFAYFLSGGRSGRGGGGSSGGGGFSGGGGGFSGGGASGKW